MISSSALKALCPAPPPPAPLPANSSPTDPDSPPAARHCPGASASFAQTRSRSSFCLSAEELDEGAAKTSGQTTLPSPPSLLPPPSSPNFFDVCKVRDYMDNIYGDIVHFRTIDKLFKTIKDELL
jgi:hypothetical protein